MTTLARHNGFWVLKVDGYTVAVKKALKDALAILKGRATQ